MLLRLTKEFLKEESNSMNDFWFGFFTAWVAILLLALIFGRVQMGDYIVTENNSLRKALIIGLAGSWILIFLGKLGWLSWMLKL